MTHTLMMDGNVSFKMVSQRSSSMHNACLNWMALILFMLPVFIRLLARASDSTSL